MTEAATPIDNATTATNATNAVAGLGATGATAPVALPAAPVLTAADVEAAATAAAEAERVRIETYLASQQTAAELAAMGEADRIKAEATAATAAAASATAAAQLASTKALATQAALIVGCPPNLVLDVVKLVDVDPAKDDLASLQAKFEAKKAEIPALFAATVEAAAPATGLAPPVGIAPPANGTTATVTGIEAGRMRAQAEKTAAAGVDKFQHFQPIGA